MNTKTKQKIKIDLCILNIHINHCSCRNIDLCDFMAEKLEKTKISNSNLFSQNVSTEPPQLLMDFEDSRDSLQDQCLNSPGSCSKQLRMARKLQAAGHSNNPLISYGNVSRSNNSTPTNDSPTPHLISQSEALWGELQETMGDTFIKPPSPMSSTSMF